jgi:DNA sulfur modification protein DndB
MNLYPAMRAHMGRWDYYVAKMNMRELAESVRFAHDVYEDKTLDDAIQRILNTGRVKQDIVTYLVHQDDRFFSSVVIAALKGNPKWYPVYISNDEKFAMFEGDPRLNETFGMLVFDGSQEYYALDGQHRLAGIKALTNPEDPSSDEAPEGFADEEMSVLLVVPSGAETERDFMRRYRRLFGNLNRYAKAMDQATNIIMDEDDAFAIVTRRLIADHEFFRVTGRQRESFRVKTDKGKNLKRTDTYFTSLESLYTMNIAMLESTFRRNNGWGPDGAGPKTKDFKRYRPTDDFIERLYGELQMYWDALLEEIPELDRDPPKMRNHDADPTHPHDDTTDHLLFWPIGQEMLAQVVRDILDKRLEDPTEPTNKAVREALRGLGGIDWRLHSPPWRFFLLTQEPDGSWKMRSEDRTEAVRIARRIVRMLLGVDELDRDGIAQLHDHWRARLVPAQTEEDARAMWGRVLA